MGRSTQVCTGPQSKRAAPLEREKQNLDAPLGHHHEQEAKHTLIPNNLEGHHLQVIEKVVLKGELTGLDALVRRTGEAEAVSLSVLRQVASFVPSDVDAA